MGDKTRSYVRLGNNATGFFAPATRFKVKAGEVKELPNGYGKDAVIMAAISGGHLVYATEAEVEAYAKKAKKEAVNYNNSDDNSEEVNRLNAELEGANASIDELNAALAEAKENLDRLNKVAELQGKSIELLSSGKEDIFKYDEEGLVSYLKETYELSKDDLKSLNKMSFEEKQNYAYDLEKESSEE